ncbi:DMT family transporter [Nodosilinea sp. LEGE 06152]|uniref:DMT family transporter n=1 Tax=Nodosilinea sp. LEGE 06152 TaxID=2777966 RepID=UPI0018818E35|nr:DMT family transporter [Nodosilinea sp. LEGE 06152]MBE9157929.1 DMT family transporter [Nodosilinea sp. LEGE 06152]
MFNFPRLLPLGSGCLAALGWGLTGTFIKLMPQFSTLEVLSIRLGIAGLVMLPILVMRRTLWSDLRMLLKDPLTVLLSSLMVLYYLFAVRAFQLAPVGDVVLVVGLSPLLGLAAKTCLRRPLTAAEGIGGVVAFSGLVLFVLPKIQGNSDDSLAYLTGLGFALLSAATTLAYASLFKFHGAKQPRLTPLLVAFITFAIGSILIIPIACLSTSHRLNDLVQPQVGTIMLGLGLISTVVPTLCYSYAAKHLSPILTTALNLMTPIFAAAVAAILLGEYLSGWNIVGASLILTGILTLSGFRPRGTTQQH